MTAAFLDMYKIVHNKLYYAKDFDNVNSLKSKIFKDLPFGKRLIYTVLIHDSREREEKPESNYQNPSKELIKKNERKVESRSRMDKMFKKEDLSIKRRTFQQTFEAMTNNRFSALLSLQDPDDPTKILSFVTGHDDMLSGESTSKDFNKMKHRLKECITRDKVFKIDPITQDLESTIEELSDEEKFNLIIKEHQELIDKQCKEIDQLNDKLISPDVKTIGVSTELEVMENATQCELLIEHKHNVNCEDCKKICLEMKSNQIKDLKKMVRDKNMIIHVLKSKNNIIEMMISLNELAESVLSNTSHVMSCVLANALKKVTESAYREMLRSII